MPLAPEVLWFSLEWWPRRHLIRLTPLPIRMQYAANERCSSAAVHNTASTLSEERSNNKLLSSSPFGAIHTREKTGISDKSIPLLSQTPDHLIPFINWPSQHWGNGEWRKLLSWRAWKRLRKKRFSWVEMEERPRLWDMAQLGQETQPC